MTFQIELQCDITVFSKKDLIRSENEKEYQRELVGSCTSRWPAAVALCGFINKGDQNFINRRVWPRKFLLRETLPVSKKWLSQEMFEKSNVTKSEPISWKKQWYNRKVNFVISDKL